MQGICNLSTRAPAQVLCTFKQKHLSHTCNQGHIFCILLYRSTKRRDMEPNGEQSPDLLELLATDLDCYFQQLVLRTQQRLYAFALRQAGSPQDAEDIVQEAYIRAYHALADYPPERIRSMKLQPWLYKITLHIFYRQASSIRLVCDPLDLSEESELLDIEEDEQEQPEKILEGRESLQELEALVAWLPEQYRIAVSC